MSFEANMIRKQGLLKFSREKTTRRTLREAKGITEIMNPALQKIIPETPTIDACIAACIRALTRSERVHGILCITAGGVEDRLCLSPRVLFLNAQLGCLWVYYTTDPVRSATHARARARNIRTRIHIFRRNDSSQVCVEREFVRCGSDACEILPSRTTSACGTIKKISEWSENKSNLGARRDRPTDRPTGPRLP